MLKGMNAIVTGGTSGIGKAIAKSFSQNGAKVALIGTNPEKGKKACQDVENSTFYRCNVGSIDEINATLGKIKEDFGTVDILVNSAAVPVRECIEDTTQESWDNYMNINLRSVFFISQYFVKELCTAENGYGRIINISSVRADLYDKTHSIYSMNKVAADSLTKAFAVNFAEKGITTNSIAPGFVETEMTGHYDENDAALQLMRNVSPMKRSVAAEEIASTALFLVSKGAAAVNGQIIKVDGGGCSAPGTYFS